MILSGTVIAEKIYDDLKNQVQNMIKKPKLSVILVGNNSSSLRYIKQKEKWAKYIWIDFELIQLDENISQKILEDEILKINNDNLVSGYIIQLPLPKHIDSKKILALVNPLKDVDGFHHENQWKLMIWDKTGFIPCTPFGIMELLNFYKIEVIGKNVVVIGRSNIVWKPIANLLIQAWGTVSVCHTQTKNIEFYTKNADIVILCAWVSWLLTTKQIQTTTVVIDVGFTVIDGKIYGDADFEDILQQGNDITPVPWWIGPLTVACLLKNTLQAFLQNQK